MEFYDAFGIKNRYYQAKKKLQHNAENDENLIDNDCDLVSENESESDKEKTVLKLFSFLNWQSLT